MCTFPHSTSCLARPQEHGQDRAQRPISRRPYRRIAIHAGATCQNSTPPEPASSTDPTLSWPTGYPVAPLTTVSLRLRCCGWPFCENLARRPSPACRRDRCVGPTLTIIVLVRTESSPIIPFQHTSKILFTPSRSIIWRLWKAHRGETPVDRQGCIEA